MATGTAPGATPAEDRPGGAAYLRLVLLAALIGIPAALLAAGFLGLVHYLESWLWHSLPGALGASSPPWYLVVGLPVAGAVIVVAARLLLPGDGGGEPLEGLSSRPTPVSHVPGVVIAAAGTLGFGAVLGPEAPVIALGSAAGMAAAGLARLAQRGTAVIAGAGATSAISALFGGPIVAGVMMTEREVGLGAALPLALLPGLVAAAIGYTIFIGFGSWGGLSAPGLTIPDLPVYGGIHVFDLLVAVVAGTIGALAIAAVHRLGTGVDSLRARVPMPVLLLAGGLVVGGLAEVAGLLGANPQDVLFSGQSALPDEVAAGSIKILGILFVFKALAYSVSLGCGYRGGPIFPAIFLGVAVASFAVVLFGVSPTVAVAIGTATGMAAQTRMLVAPLVFAALLTGKAGLDVIPATVLAAAAAWLTATALGQRGARLATPSAGAAQPAPPRLGEE
jgi:H+/Cl- antiporter ClcA